MVKKRSKQNNPEQKTRNGANSQDVEFGRDFDAVKQSKKIMKNQAVSLLNLNFILNRNNLHK